MKIIWLYLAIDGRLWPRIRAYTSDVRPERQPRSPFASYPAEEPF